MRLHHLKACVRLCRRLGISIESTHVAAPLTMGAAASSYTDTPSAYACDVVTKKIIVPGGKAWRKEALTVDEHGPEYGFEAWLHECMHVLMQPPFATISEVPEDWLIMQVELPYALAIGDAAAVRAVKAWQDVTMRVTVDAGPNDCGEDWRRRKPWWKEGYRLARKLGVLNKRNEPTWRWPDWDALTLAESESWRDRVVPDEEG